MMYIATNNKCPGTFSSLIHRILRRGKRSLTKRSERNCGEVVRAFILICNCRAARRAEFIIGAKSAISFSHPSCMTPLDHNLRGTKARLRAKRAPCPLLTSQAMAYRDSQRRSETCCGQVAASALCDPVCKRHLRPPQLKLVPSQFATFRSWSLASQKDAGFV
jgi:hypothetical protein